MTDTCDDYACERPAEDHGHVGVRPHLRRVMDHGRLIDGKTLSSFVPPSKSIDPLPLVTEANAPFAKTVPGSIKPTPSSQPTSKAIESPRRPRAKQEGYRPVSTALTVRTAAGVPGVTTTQPRRVRGRQPGLDLRGVVFAPKVERTHEELLAQDQTVCLLCGHKYVSHALGGGKCYMTPCSCQKFWADL